MRTCRELGIATVAVYSELDRDALHVRYADEAYALGGQTAAESYLNTDAILDAIERSGAEAVHPGYGFFSENADFARAITDAGRRVDRPAARGDRDHGRQDLVAEGGRGRRRRRRCPAPSTRSSDASEVVAFGDEYGWPVAIKAAYGGGGKGLKVAHGADDAAGGVRVRDARGAGVLRARASATSSATSPGPRHIEIQVFADTHGNVVWLGERDCSTQRRHQKLIEESPAPALDDERPRRDGRGRGEGRARRAATSNAGTVECLYQDGEFWFLEMNTRLQVEHCVTEMVTSLDLVAEQLRVAAGEPLSFTQDDIERRGHSIECRINAEDPATGFLPSPGTITRLRLPGGPGVRWDGGYAEGDTVSQHYDNLIGKLVVWAPDREAARHRMLRALGEFEIAGRRHHDPRATSRCSSHPDFAAGTHSTKWVEDEVDASVFADTAPTPTRPRPPTAPTTPRARRAHGAGRGRRQALLGQALAARGPGGRRVAATARGGAAAPGHRRPAAAPATARSPRRCRARS